MSTRRLAGVVALGAARPRLPDVAARSRGQGGAPGWTNDLDRGEDRDNVGLVAGAADRRAKSRTLGLEVLPRWST
jgi:hypothetical protein